MLNKSFWKNKRVFLTGHTGFKGTWMSVWLEMMGADVTGYSLAPTSSPNLFDETGITKKIKSIIGDVRNFDQLKEAIENCSPEILIHMAAQPLVRYSYDNPLETFSTNVMGTVNLFEAAKISQNLKVIINVTTDKCYENKEWEWGYREDEPMGGLDPYSCSKGCSELITNSFRHSFYKNIAISSARAGNVIGGGDWADDRLIPDALRAFEKLENVKIRNPKSTRPWQHVLEPISGYLLLAEKLYQDHYTFSGAWNFGPNDSDAISVESMVKQLCSKWSNDCSWEIDNSCNLHEANLLKLDISKARHKLNWEPKWSSSDAIDRIIEWHRGWLDGKNSIELCTKQIKKYTGEKDD